MESSFKMDRDMATSSVLECSVAHLTFPPQENLVDLCPIMQHKVSLITYILGHGHLVIGLLSFEVGSKDV